MFKDFNLRDLKLCNYSIPPKPKLPVYSVTPLPQEPITFKEVTNKL